MSDGWQKRLVAAFGQPRVHDLFEDTAFASIGAEYKLGAWIVRKAVEEDVWGDLERRFARRSRQDLHELRLPIRANKRFWTSVASARITPDERWRLSVQVRL